MATCYYSAGFHVGELNALTPLGTLTLRTGGETDIVIDLATDIVGFDFNLAETRHFFHSHVHTTTFWTLAGNVTDDLPVLKHFSTGSWGAYTTQVLSAQRVAEGWPAGAIDMRFHETTLAGAAFPQYRLTYAGAAFTYQFSTLAGARLYGVNVTTESASATEHVLGTPWFVLWPRSNGISAPSDEFSAHDYEPREIASLVHSDSGLAYGNSRLVAPLWRDWMQRFETADNMLIGAGMAATPFRWTHQHLKQHCRTRFPIIVANGGFGSGYNYETFLLRDDGASWRPQRASIANNAQLHEPYRTVSVGRITTAL